MPPRHSYWTIILEGKPTAFRAHTREELLPTLKQLQGRHPDSVMKWFARGRLWQSPEEERDANRRPPRGDHRGPAWRPGGEHSDPRDRFKITRDEKRRRFAADLRRDQRGPDSERPPSAPPGDRPERPAGERDRNRPPRKPWNPQNRSGSGDSTWTSRPPQGAGRGDRREGSKPRPPQAEDERNRSAPRESRPPHSGAPGWRPGWKKRPPHGATGGDRPAWRESRPPHGKPGTPRPDWKKPRPPDGQGRGGDSRSDNPEWRKPRGPAEGRSDRPDWKRSGPPRDSGGGRRPGPGGETGRQPGGKPGWRPSGPPGGSGGGARRDRPGPGRRPGSGGRPGGPGGFRKGGGKKGGGGSSR